MGGHPLRSPTRHRLGRPLPYQLADGTQAPPEVNMGSFTQRFLNPSSTWGISSPFEPVSPASGQVTNALLTRSPLRTLLLFVRLACIRHAASVHPEPGSNSPQNLPSPFQVFSVHGFFTGLDGVSLPSYHSSVVKVLSIEQGASQRLSGTEKRRCPSAPAPRRLLRFAHPT